MKILPPVVREYLHLAHSEYTIEELKRMFASRKCDTYFAHIGQMACPEIEDEAALAWIGYEILTLSPFCEFRFDESRPVRPQC